MNFVCHEIRKYETSKVYSFLHCYILDEETYGLLLLVIFNLESYQVASQLPIAISKGAKFLIKGMGEEFVSAIFSDFASVAVSFLQDIVKHGLFYLFGKSNDEILKISYSLKQICDQQKQILTDIEKLSSKLSTIVSDVIIAEDERKIKDCVDSYEWLLQNPDSETYVEQVKQCENIHAEVRSISRTLKTMYIFRKITNELGYCNGQYLMKVLNYLFNLYLEGYCILLAAHQLQGKNESHFYINEYKTSLEQIHQSVNEEISACAMEYCKGVPIYSKQIPESADNQGTLDLLHKAFPWYRFYMFKLKHGSKYSLKDIKADVVEFKNQTETADVVLLYVNNIDSKMSLFAGILT